MAVATEREYGLFINGESTEPASGEVRELSEPATGEPLARVASAGEEDVDRAVEAAQSALAGDWGKTPPTERSRLLHALADAIQANRKELAELEARITQLLKQPVPIRDPRRFDLHGFDFGHRAGLPARIRLETRRALAALETARHQAYATR